MRISILSIVAALCCCVSARAAELSKPVRLNAGGELIDTEIGHAAPFLGDFDGDGRRDLLVGQFRDGKLKIYRNIGGNQQPDYEPATFFQTQGEVVKVPTG